MSTVEFLRPKLVGARFEGHAIPLEILKDLAVLEEMVIEVAKWQFRQDHPERARVPRGFTYGIELKLTAVEDGSAIPVIFLCIASLGTVPSDNQVYLEKARESIVRAVAAAEQNTVVTDHLPANVLGYFDRVGRGLREGEAIEFTTQEQPAPARLTRESRRRLVAASNIRELTEETTVRGVVPEVDQDDMTFEVQTMDGRKIKAPLPSQHVETILEAFNGYAKGVRVLLQGIGKFNQKRLEGFESIEHVGFLDPLDIPTRLYELRSLKDGWLEGRGKALHLDGLDWLAKAFEDQFPADLALPYMYPTAEGGIQAEWTISSTEITLNIDLSSRKAEWHSVHLDTHKEHSQNLDLSTGDGWHWVAEMVRSSEEGTT